MNKVELNRQIIGARIDQWVKIVCSRCHLFGPVGAIGFLDRQMHKLLVDSPVFCYEADVLGRRVNYELDSIDIGQLVEIGIDLPIVRISLHSV